MLRKPFLPVSAKEGDEQTCKLTGASSQRQAWGVGRAWSGQKEEEAVISY